MKTTKNAEPTPPPADAEPPEPAVGGSDLRLVRKSLLPPCELFPCAWGYKTHKWDSNNENAHCKRCAVSRALIHECRIERARIIANPETTVVRVFYPANAD